jgi:hypothetical protein
MVLTGSEPVDDFAYDLVGFAAVAVENVKADDPGTAAFAVFLDGRRVHVDHDVHRVAYYDRCIILVHDTFEERGEIHV